MSKRSLDDILAEQDALGLLDVKPRGASISTEESRLLEEFSEINTFVERHKREPGVVAQGASVPLHERMLQQRLSFLRTDIDHRDLLVTIDRNNLLQQSQVVRQAPKSLDEILNLDDELLSTPADHIFDLKHVRSGSAQPDKISERRTCEDFEKFEPLFEALTADLKNGKREAVKFSSDQTIRAGEFFILGGIVTFVAEVNNPHIRNGRPDARLRVIFENGTEADHLLRSLSRLLYDDPNGRQISNPYLGPLLEQTKKEQAIEEHDRVFGSIYVVKSLSTHPDIKKLDGNFFKIGFTTGSVADRIRNAAKEPEYLLAPVTVVATFDAVNVNPNKVENVLHRFFASARLDFEMKDRFDIAVNPREWFVVRLDVIREVIGMLLDGRILGHRYDDKTGKIIPIKR
jgi:hypothetical protein